jgi:hypothetical protein
MGAGVSCAWLAVIEIATRSQAAPWQKLISSLIFRRPIKLGRDPANKAALLPAARQKRT